MPEPDCTVVLRRLDEIHWELRAGFRTLELRAAQRAASRQTLFQTLTRQMEQAVAALRCGAAARAGG